MHIIKKILPWVFFICLAIILVGSLAVRILNTPLAPKLEVTESGVQPAATAITPIVDSASDVQSTPTQALCSGQGSSVILVLGESFPVDSKIRGADAIRLVKVDYGTGKVTVTAFPPVLMVNTSQIPSLGANASTLTSAYFLAKQSFTDSERNKMAYASNVIAQTLVTNFGLTPDNYLTMKQNTFKNAVDTMGGLPITLSAPVITPSNGVIVLPAGQQVITGQQALDYSRYIQSGSSASVAETNRFNRQNEILLAILHQALSFQSLPDYPGLVNNFYQDVATDLSLNQLMDLACVLQNPQMDVDYVEFKSSLIVSEQNGILIPNTSAIASYYQPIYSH